jgi:hypothetical protein
MLRAAGGVLARPDRVRYRDASTDANIGSAAESLAPNRNAVGHCEAARKCAGTVSPIVVRWVVMTGGRYSSLRHLT